MVRPPFALLRVLCAASSLSLGACLDWSSTRSRADHDAGDDAGADADTTRDEDASAETDEGAEDGGDPDAEGAQEDASAEDAEIPSDAGDPSDADATGDGAVDADVPAPVGACPASACHPSQPCTGDANRYTCAGQYADFPLPSRRSGDSLAVQRLTVDRNVIRDDVTGLMWQREGFPTSVLLADAHAYCGELALGGHDDWRVPSIHEFITILGGETATDVDTTQFLHWNGDDYHTATLDSESLDAHVMIRTYGGIYTFSGAVDQGGSVLCVRTDSVLYTGTPAARFVVDGALVHDTRTGLWWEKVTPLARSALSSADAADYCATLQIGARTFRLPRMAELVSFIDFARGSVARLPVMFSGPLNANYVSGTRVTNIGSTSAVVAVSFGGGVGFYDTLTERFAVRCVSPD